MSQIAVALPILPGKKQAFQQFASDIKTKYSKEFKASRERLGVRERVFLHQTSQGDMVIVTLEGNDPAGAFAAIPRGDDAYTKWFINAVKEIHGVDISQPMAPPTLIADSES